MGYANVPRVKSTYTVLNRVIVFSVL